MEKEASTSISVIDFVVPKLIISSAVAWNLWLYLHCVVTAAPLAASLNSPQLR